MEMEDLNSGISNDPQLRGLVQFDHGLSVPWGMTGPDRLRKGGCPSRWNLCLANPPCLLFHVAIPLFLCQEVTYRRCRMVPNGDGCVVGPLGVVNKPSTLMPAWLKLAVIPFHRCCAYVSKLASHHYHLSFIHLGIPPGTLKRGRIPVVK